MAPGPKERLMYTREQLEKYPYFAERLRDTTLETVLDPLTGLTNQQQ